MASPADAKALESFAKTQLAALGMAAQVKGLGKIVDSVEDHVGCEPGSVHRERSI